MGMVRGWACPRLAAPGKRSAAGIASCAARGCRGAADLQRDRPFYFESRAAFCAILNQDRNCLQLLQPFCNTKEFCPRIDRSRPSVKWRVIQAQRVALRFLNRISLSSQENDPPQRGGLFVPITDVVLGLAAGVGIDLSPDGKRAYFVEWSIGELSLVEVASGLVSTIRTGLSFPQDVEVDWDTGAIYISERTGNIIQIGAEGQPRVIASPGGAPHQLALVKDGGDHALYTVCFDSGQLLRLDLLTGATTVIASGFGHPIGLVLDRARKYAFLTEQDSGSLVQVELATGARTSIVGGLIAPFFLAWDKDHTSIFCVQRDPANNLIRIKPGSPTTLSLVAGGLAWRPSGVAPNADDSLIYICADRELEVIGPAGTPTIPPGIPPFEVHSIQFHFDGSQTIPLKHHQLGVMVPTPEYEAGGRNEPAAYLVNTTPRIKVVFRRLPGFVPGTYAVGATGSLGGIRRRYIAPTFNSAGLTGPIEFDFLWPLPGFVSKPDVTLDWYARFTAAPSAPAPIGFAIHRLYLLLARPTAPWTQEPAWVAGLEIACGWASGAANKTSAATLITEHYNGSGRVSYDTTSGATLYGLTTFQFSQMIERLNGGLGLGEKVNCTDSANTVSTLTNLIGCDLWQSRMGYSFAMNEVIAIGFNVWEVPFGTGFYYHEVAWEGACDVMDRLFDGCLKVDGDADPTLPPRAPLLPTNMIFGDCGSLNYRLRLCPPQPGACGNCQPRPSTRLRRPIA